MQDMLSNLQSCITWTKKSSKGWTTWKNACAHFQRKVLAFITPVKTRFTSVSPCNTVLLFLMCLLILTFVDAHTDLEDADEFSELQGGSGLYVWQHGGDKALA